MRARDTHRIVATSPATPAAGVEQIKPVAAAQDKRSFHQRTLPRRVIPNQFLGLAQELGAVLVQSLRPDGSRHLTAVAIFLPNQITLSFFIGDRNRINGTGGL